MHIYNSIQSSPRVISELFSKHNYRKLRNSVFKKYSKSAKEWALQNTAQSVIIFKSAGAKAPASHAV